MVSNARKTAIEAALEAGSFIRDRVGLIKTVDYKGAFNIVTDVDKASEIIILEILKGEFPNDCVLAEEGGNSAPNGKSERRWLVDPLDGTTNFTHAYPFFAVSIGLEESGELVLGVVYNPMSNELFWAEKGEGAWLNDDRIHVSSVDAIAESLLFNRLSS